MQKDTLRSQPTIKRYEGKDHIINSKKNSRVSSSFGIATIIALIVTDQVRLSLPGQPIYISFFPLLLSIIGALLAFKSGALRNLPKSLRIAVFWIVVLCAYGSLIGFANELLFKQIMAGWISYAGLVPGLLLGYTIGKSDFSSAKFSQWNYYVLLSVLMIAVFQQFGLFRVEQIVLEGTGMVRGVRGLGYFKYTTGPFRTASVFSIFLACSSAIFLFSYLRLGKNIKSVRVISIIILVLLGSFLAARRSGLIMLLGVIVPFFFLGVTRIWLRTIILIVLFFVIGGQFFNEDFSNVKQEIGLKFSHSVTDTEFTDRAKQVFDVRDSDWDLVSLWGEGLGSYGPGVRVAGSAAVAKAKARLIMHPIIHFGWFKDLAVFGPLGLIIHLIFFYWIGVGVNPYMVIKRKTGNSVLWSGFGLYSGTVIVYFFIATSWLQGITGGLMFGLSMGFVSGCLNSINLRSL